MKFEIRAYRNDGNRVEAIEVATMKEAIDALTCYVVANFQVPLCLTPGQLWSGWDPKAKYWRCELFDCQNNLPVHEYYLGDGPLFRACEALSSQLGEYRLAAPKAGARFNEALNELMQQAETVAEIATLRKGRQVPEAVGELATAMNKLGDAVDAVRKTLDPITFRAGSPFAYGQWAVIQAQTKVICHLSQQCFWDRTAQSVTDCWPYR